MDQVVSFDAFVHALFGNHAFKWIVHHALASEVSEGVLELVEGLDELLFFFVDRFGLFEEILVLERTSGLRELVLDEVQVLLLQNVLDVLK